MRVRALQLFLALLALSSPVQAQAPADRLSGLWGYEHSYGPAVRGTLTLDGRAPQWRAEVGGISASVQHVGDSVQFSMPGGQGDFRGRAAADGKRIEGFWIQPRGQTLQARYASPLTLSELSPGVWEGQVHPLEDRVSLYMSIAPATGGGWTGFIRNPEFNMGLRRPLEISVVGEDILFANARRKNDVLHGRFDEETGDVSLSYQGVGTWDFARRDAAAAPGFHPRTPATSKFDYVPPVLADDGWKVGTLQQAGMDPAPVAKLVEQLQAGVATSVNSPYIHALLVARHGKLVLEEYFHGFDRTQTHDSRSSGKSLASMLVGIARERGGFDVDTPVVRYLSAMPANPDPRKDRITIAQLMSMTSGLACDDNDDASPGNEDVMQSQSKQSDWYRYTLDLPMARDPGGEQAVYCSAGINLLGAVVSKASGMELPEFFDRYYARPLDIRDYHMNLAADGAGYLGGGMHLRPRDALKLGQLYLDQGKWNGRRVVSADWVAESTKPRAHFDPGHGYGYAWHLHEVKVGERSYRTFAAEGNGGQFVIVVPELEMTVLIAAGNYGDFATWYKFQDFVPQYLIPAIAR